MNSQSKAIDFIEFDRSIAYSGKRAFKKQLNSLLNINSEFSFEAISEIEDQLGEVHVRYQQLLHGIPIEGKQYVGHFNIGVVKRANGRYVK